MPHEQLDRRALQLHALKDRPNRVLIERDHILPDHAPEALKGDGPAQVARLTMHIRQAREAGRPVVLALGAHAIKNGLAPVLAWLIDAGWVTHLATNGAGVIHDWEFAYLGESSEHVAANAREGKFGIWQETGFYLNLAIVIGAWRGLGYGESVGAMIHEGVVRVPERDELLTAIAQAENNPEQAAAAADLLRLIEQGVLTSGEHRVEHPHATYSIQARAYALGIPFTAHPMFGHDIIYTHPLNCGAAIGRAAERDFLSFAHSIRQIDGGVYMSIGSAVMSPMIFEKSYSMSQNLALAAGESIDNHFIQVVDLAPAQWDWSQGEPPEDHPDYYLRFNKTFSRMGGSMQYLTADNRDFLLTLVQALQQ